MNFLSNNLRRFRESSLLMNSVYLMLATIVIAGFGFIFWVVITRTYDAGTVGLAATLLTLSGLLSMLSLVGFDTTFVRFLPHEAHKSDQINSGMVIVTLTSFLLSVVFVLSFPLTSPRLMFVLQNPWYFAGFVFFTIITSLNTLTNAVFLALKQARDIFIINLLFSTVKVALPLIFLHGNVMTIFVLVGISQLAGLILSLAIIKAHVGFNFVPKINLGVLRAIKQYSLSVYISSVLNLLPPTLIPLLIVHELGAEDAAYYYMAFTIASVLYTISYASMQSAFAEGSHDEKAMRTHVIKAVKLIGALLTPAILVTVAFSGLVLKIFGKSYSTHGTMLLELFAVSAFAVALYSALGTIFKITKNLRGVVVMNLVYASTILGLSYILLSHEKLLAIGWAWLFGNILAGVTGLLFLKSKSK